MIRIQNETEFKEAIQVMQSKRNNGRRPDSRGKWYIKTVETDTLIAVGGYFRIHLKIKGQSIWCNNIILNKQENILTLNDGWKFFKTFDQTDFEKITPSAILDNGEPAPAVYNLDEVAELRILHF